MAPPLSATEFKKALVAEGLTVKEYRADWSTHNRGQRGDGWGPVHGILLHHTATRGDTPARTAASVKLCYDGHADLPGPLCHGVIDKQGVVHLVGYGRTNHAGLGDDDVLRAVIAEKKLPPDNEANTDGNARLYGFECINLGDGKDTWPPEQVDAMVRASAALVRAHGWGKDGDTSVLGHLEWQPGKVDPRGPGFPGMNKIRSLVAERITHPASWTPGTGGPSQATYTVRDGDNLTKISKKFGVPVDTLVSLNRDKIDDPDEISIGMKLKLK